MPHQGSRIAVIALVAGWLLGSGCTEEGPSKPAGPPTLNTGVDPVRMAAEVTPIVAEWVRDLSGAGLSDIGFNSPADADALQVGRPYGVFTLHRGPWLEFHGGWRAAVLAGGAYRSVVEIRSEGGKYVAVSLGSTGLASVLAERETQPGLSAALDAGRAGLLRLVNQGGISLLAYEAATPDTAAQPDIRVQDIFGAPVVLPGMDGAAGPQESTLAEISETLPAE